MHIQGFVAHISGPTFDPDQMELDLSPWDLYKGATKDYMIHVFELVVLHHQLYSQIWGTSSHQNKKIKIDN